MTSKKMHPKSELYEYVLTTTHGIIRKNNGAPLIVRAKSKKIATQIAHRELGDRGRDWDVRRAGDEPRIAAIDDYVNTVYLIGQLDREIRDLESKRRELESNAEDYRNRAYDLPAGPKEDSGWPF